MKLFNYTRCLCLSLSLLVLASCNVENPIDGEQYIKQVYLVGAYDKLQGKEVAYGSEREIFVSVAIGGTISLDHDVTIRLEQADYINIDNYNKKNVVGDDIPYEAMPQELYNIPSWEGTIKAGEEYVRIPIHIYADQVNCDKRYIIPLRIAEVSDYEPTPTDTVLMVNLKMVNEYSGTYIISGTNVRYENDEPIVSETSSLNTPRTMIAVDQYTVRLFHKVESEELTNADKAAMKLIVNPTDNTVTIEPWKDLPILKGGGTFDVEKRTFTIWYHYMENGKEYRTEATIVKNKS